MARRKRHSRRAVTLVELLTGLLITSLIALGIASMLHAASYGTSSKREVRRLMVRSQQLRMRFDDAVRNARAILACGQDGDNRYIVLWRGDIARDDENPINLSELCLIEWVATSQSLTCYEAASTPDPNTDYACGADFYDIADQARTSNKLTGTLWSEAVSSFEMTLDRATPADARMVSWSATVTDELLTEWVVGVVSVRSLAQFE